MDACEIERRAIEAERAQVFAEVVQQLEHSVAAVDRRHVNSGPAVGCGGVEFAAIGHKQLHRFHAAVGAGQVQCVHLFLLSFGMEIRPIGEQRLDVGRLVFHRGDVQRRLAKRVERIDRLAKPQRLPQRVGVISRGELVQGSGLDLRGWLRLRRRGGGRLKFARPAAGLAKRKSERRQEKRPTGHPFGLGLVHPSRESGSVRSWRIQALRRLASNEKQHCGWLSRFFHLKI